jgi:hypothetical protein
MDNRELLALILPRLRVVRGPNAKGEYLAWCEFHADGKGKPPHEPNFNVSERGGYCHVCKWGGGLVKLATELEIELPKRGRGSLGGPVVRWYDYRDEQGRLLFQVGRKEPKGFTQRCPEANGDWKYSLNGTRRVPYRLPELLANPDTIVYVVEGEKDVDRLLSLGLTATTNSEGAEKWRSEHSESLRARNVVILPDNDDAGRRHALVVSSALKGIAESVKIVELPGLPVKGDVSDWLNAGHSREDLDREIAQASARDDDKQTDQETTKSTRKSGSSQADRIVTLARSAGL